MYTYNAIVRRVIDGDSLVLDVDLGFHTWIREQSFRLLGSNARELHEPGGPEARDNLGAILPPGTPVTITSVKPDKFRGRMDAVITLADGTDLVARLIAEQWACAWTGKGVRPVPLWPRTVGVD